MADLKSKSFKRLIREYEFLLEDLEDVAEIHKQANIDMSSEINKVKPKDIFEKDYLEEDEEASDIEAQHDDKELKKLFRKIVFICHPDKVKDLEDRELFENIYMQAVEAHDNCNWAMMVILAIKLDIELPESAEDQVEKIQNDVKNLRDKINGMTNSYVWQWYHADLEKQKEMVEKYIIALSESLKNKDETNGVDMDE